MQYEIHEVLGRGGMGEVYRATDRTSGEVVALKALRTDLLLPHELFERFEREGEALRRLNHPNIVKSLGSFEHDGRRYLVMEYVDGGSLRSLLSQPLVPERLLGVALDVADALTRAHRLQIIHRDLKPDNVMLGQDGVARLADFGIAHVDGHLTAAGAVLGTAAYLSPEACLGQAASPAQDIWAFGVMLFEMLTARLPFQGVAAILNQPVPDLQALRPGAPEALVDLIYRMLDRNPATRIPSVRQVGSELEAVAPWPEHEPATAAPAPQLSTLLGSRYASSGEPAPRRSLPSPAHPFVGSEAELTRLQQLLTSVSCLTLLGPGGVGKSRLALEIASRSEELFPGGVVFVPLAALDSAERLPAALAEALRFSFAGERSPLEQLAERLGGQPSLMVLDNFDELATESAWLGRLLAACPSVRWLVTSRTRLNLSAETLHEVRELNPQEAEELFVGLARRALPDYQLSADQASHVKRICRLVGGMPLGLELAAAWVRLLSPGEIADELERDLSLLESRAQDVSERHRSLRAAFEYSWRQLPPASQQVLCQLSVFRGGFSREAAQTVTGASLPGLLGLVDRSLLRRRASGRFEVHELIRQFAAERLSEADATRDRHADYYSEFLERKGKALDEGGRGWSELFDELEREMGNCRAAWLRSVEGSRLENLGRAWDGLETYLDLRGRNEEIAELLGPALQCAERSGASPRVLGKLLTSQALMSGGDEAIFARALELLEDHPVERAATLTYMAYWLHFFRDRAREALAAAQEAVEVHRARGHRQATSFALTLAAICRAALGEDPEPELQEAERIYRVMEGPYLARFLGHRATLELTRGRFEQARQDAGESQAMARALDDRPGTCKCLLILAQLSGGEQARGYAVEALELGRSLASRSAIIRSLSLLARELARAGQLAPASEVLGNLNALPGLPAHARETLDLVLQEFPAAAGPPPVVMGLSALVERFLASR